MAISEKREFGANAFVKVDGFAITSKINQFKNGACPVFKLIDYSYTR